MISEAMRLLRAGHPEAALALLQPALERDAAAPELLKAGINAAMACGRIDLAWSWFQALCAQGFLDPSLARVGSKLANRRGTELEREGQGEPALELYRQSLDLWPENDDARVNSIRMLCALADPRLLDLTANTLPADSIEWVTTLQAATITYQAHSVGFSAWRNNFAKVLKTLNLSQLGLVVMVTLKKHFNPPRLIQLI